MKFLLKYMMHLQLGNGSVAFEIFDGARNATMQPSTHLLLGTLDSLNKAGASVSFYWMLSVANVVVPRMGRCIFFRQLLREPTQIRRRELARKVWSNINPKVRTGIWHFFLVTDNELDALEYVRMHSEALHNFKLGKDRIMCMCRSGVVF